MREITHAILMIMWYRVVYLNLFNAKNYCTRYEIFVIYGRKSRLLINQV